MGAWHSPQSIYNIGHRAVVDLFSVPVQIQEKVDGSFFAFGFFPDDYPDEPVKVRSKRAVMVPDAPESLFKPAVKAVTDRLSMLHPNWQYRAETLASRKHNSLFYDRVPKDNIILFDILTEEETYLPYEDLYAEAKRLDLEVVPQLFAGRVSDAQQLRQYLDTTSILGGQKIEGMVIKPLEPMYGPDKKMLFAKFVSEAFKEVHRGAWKENNPGPKDIILRLGEMYSNPARFQKALIHLREEGMIEDSPRDIGKLVKEVPADILKECEDEIKGALFAYAWPHISRLITREIPTWYKDLLMRKQFEQELQ
jgi:hypothetical protein